MNVANVLAIEDVRMDIDLGKQFYDDCEPGIGDYFKDCIVVDIESLRLFAGVHSKHYGYFRMLSARFPFAIYYDIQSDTAIIVAVLDMRRNPSTIRRTLNKRSP